MEVSVADIGGATAFEDSTVLHGWFGSGCEQVHMEHGTGVALCVQLFLPAVDNLLVADWPGTATPLLSASHESLHSYESEAADSRASASDTECISSDGPDGDALVVTDVASNTDSQVGTEAAYRAVDCGVTSGLKTPLLDSGGTRQMFSGLGVSCY
ncbi:hypothetical protein CYMTET_49418 [Cymbomonas tetramitiformis]|uniref:Uncharacterized protein n=1 Tax=Cymbomonas tetramitiformis TaxID=36881 RepID=A0AAE0BQB8_9CHLO|nr:hypothetical protein CYMTET_49418 [Cymbomonas tetramitiformis]